MGKGAGKGGLVTYDNGEFWAVIFALEGSIFDNVASKIVTVCVISFIAAALNTQGYFDNSPDSVVEPINKFGFTLAGARRPLPPPLPLQSQRPPPAAKHAAPLRQPALLALAQRARSFSHRAHV